MISYFEDGDELVPKRAKLCSRLPAPRRVSYLIVMIMAIFVFAPIGLSASWILLITRVLGVPADRGAPVRAVEKSGETSAQDIVAVESVGAGHRARRSADGQRTRSRCGLPVSRTFPLLASARGMIR